VFLGSGGALTKTEQPRTSSANYRLAIYAAAERNERIYVLGNTFMI